MKNSNTSLRLREVEYSDWEHILTWRNSDKFLSFITSKKKCNNISEYKKVVHRHLSSGNWRHFLIVDHIRKGPIGLVYAYDFATNNTNTNTYVTSFIRGGLQNFGFGIRATILFAEQLFSIYSGFMSEILFEVVKENKDSFQLMIKLDFDVVRNLTHLRKTPSGPKKVLVFKMSNEELLNIKRQLRIN